MLPYKENFGKDDFDLVRLIDLELAIDPPPPQGEFCTL